MKHTLAAARAVAAHGSITGPHAPYMLIVYALAEKSCTALPSCRADTAGQSGRGHAHRQHGTRAQGPAFRPCRGSTKSGTQVLPGG